MKLEFEEWTLVEFNNLLVNEILATDTFDKAVDKIENEDLNYFYITMNKEDVEDAVDCEKEIADQLKLRYVFVVDICMYIAIPKVYF